MMMTGATAVPGATIVDSEEPLGDDPTSHRGSKTRVRVEKFSLDPVTAAAAR